MRCWVWTPPVPAAMPLSLAKRMRIPAWLTSCWCVLPVFQPPCAYCSHHLTGSRYDVTLQACFICGIIMLYFVLHGRVVLKVQKLLRNAAGTVLLLPDDVLEATPAIHKLIPSSLKGAGRPEMTLLNNIHAKKNSRM